MFLDVQELEIGTIKSLAITTIKSKQVNNIYTWTDYNDVYHISDKVPEDGQIELLDYEDKKVFDYFSLNVNTESLP